jgi:hypothetical protein
LLPPRALHSIAIPPFRAPPAQPISSRINPGMVKVHLQLDLKTAIPEFIQITPASVHEVNILDNITFQPDSFYVVDRGYTST